MYNLETLNNEDLLQEDDQIYSYQNQVETLNNEDLLQEDDQICSYQNQALTLMQVYKLEDKEEFLEWLHWFEYVADIISIPPDKMVEFFNCMVDTDVHTYVKKIYPIHEFCIFSYEDTVKHYSIELYRRRFISRIQYENETLLEYSYNLLKIFNECYYPSDFEECLCEQFNYGLQDDNIRNHLRQKPCLSFDETLAQAIEFCNNTFLTYYKDLALLRIHSYNLGMKDDFCDWLNKFEYVADSIRVPDKMMIELFKNMIDDDTHTNVKKIAPDIDSLDLSYKDITSFYLFVLFESDETDSYKKRLQCRNQYEEETIEKYADKLEKIYNECYNKEQLIDSLCRQFRKGIHNNKIKQFLSKYPTLSFYETVSKAVTFQEVNESNYNTHCTFALIKMFKSEKELDICDWLNKFEYKTFNFVCKDEMIKFFNESVDNNVHNRVKEKYSSVNFSELSYVKIIDHYLRYFSPTDEMFLHRRRLFCREQYEEETLKNYACSLQKIHSNCNYTCYADERLSDQFVSGIRGSDIKKYLEIIPYLSFHETVAKAIEFVKANEIKKYVNQALLWIDRFHSENYRTFCEWFNNFEYVADMIKVPKDKMIAFFNEMVDNDLHKQVRNNNISVNFSNLSYKEIINLYIVFIKKCNQTHFHTYRFYQRYQYEEETIENYFNNLRKIFKKTLLKSERAFRREFLKGIRNYKIRAILNEHYNKMPLKDLLAKAIELEKLINENKEF
ncbi:PREDICTED: uncharacterized protein LOC107071462 isoform X2 [Polistes dominula]|uniref:Uncharacterized protein LOC107071462 isoform X1 n=1 Tax=Polistes dominula TaxID=743375 RepID=A0ABM1J0I9_POLDO|nr:PREDICTED: uncharacterized protein LOC107071462 isoform X1 [Polistes dominula]XP_015185977.1 PREDICTED: uncharacterized protein LOC107071462 isoform X2 [Polistes dominula]